MSDPRYIITDGYPGLSRFVSTYSEYCVFRRFGALNARNLLYLQAEITRLEIELEEIAEEDHESDDPEKKTFHQHWWALSQAGSESGNNLQWQKMLELRGLLETYNTSLLQQAEMLKLSSPEQRSLVTLQEWFRHPAHGNFALKGSEADVFETKHEKDLVALSSAHVDRDAFSLWFTNTFTRLTNRYWLVWFRNRTSASVSQGLTEFSDTKLNTSINFISSMIAAALPAASIFILQALKTLTARLGAIMGLSMLFTAAISAFTGGRRIEMFAATVAYVDLSQPLYPFLADDLFVCKYAAVLVVFVGNADLPGSSSSSPNAHSGNVKCQTKS